MRTQEQRTTARFSVRFRSSFTSTNVIGGEGSVVDVSIRGCRIETTVQVHTGTVLELRLYLSKDEPPLDVAQAVVRWTRGRHFGVEFVGLEPEEWARLQHLVKDLERQPVDTPADPSSM
ncbi:hypothetical protein YTPLAS18_23110 [Nitrospira sp.]|nr:hypothetical protein YTPLAS18_23110 [Nitrospira sp.]